MSRALGGWTRTLANWLRASWPVSHEPLDLPEVKIGPLMTDDDVEFWSDYMELRNSLDDLLDACIASGDKLRGGVNLVDAERFAWDWPVDEAELLLICWRAEREAVSA